MTLRVLHVLDHSLPLQSGYAFRTRAIVREQQRLGWETAHLTTPKQGATQEGEEQVDGLHFYRTPWQLGALQSIPAVAELAMMRATARRLEEVVQRVRPNLIQAHSPALNAIPALIVGRRHSIPVVYEVRAFWEDAAADHGTSREWGMRYRLTRALESFALRRVDHVTTICEGLKRDIASRGVPQERITVIPNAVDTNAFEFEAEPDVALKHDLGLSGALIVGFIGSFYAYEGLDLLLRALPMVTASRPEVRLLLVGGGPHEAALRTLCDRLGLGNKVCFAGRVSHRDVQRYYSIVDVFAYPRRSMRLTELVTPLKPLEAMAQGRLLVASDVGGHRELIRDGETGLLFRAGDSDSLARAILLALAERGSSQRLREQGRRFVERERNWAASVERYRAVFINLTAAAQ